MSQNCNTFQQEPIVKLEPNVEKIITAISFLIAEADKLGQILTQYEIGKTLFLADRKHLNDYGRPITFDNYYAMQYGPIPNLTYDLLKGNKRAITKIGGKVPWTTKKSEGTKLLFSLKKQTQTDSLSSSDKEALSFGLELIRQLSFSQIVNLTHKDRAYSQAWDNKDEDDKRALMDLACLFDTPNIEAAQQLAFVSKHQ